MLCVNTDKSNHDRRFVDSRENGLSRESFYSSPDTMVDIYQGDFEYVTADGRGEWKF